MFEKHHNTYKRASKNPQPGEEDDTGLPGNKEARNLLTLITELYNFQVISCVLIYDLVNIFIADLDEFNVEMLLKIMRSMSCYRAKPIERTFINPRMYFSIWSPTES